MKFGPLVGSIDEGTSSARFILFKAGTDEIVCYHQLNVPSIYPKEGWVEQDPVLIIDIVEKCIEGALQKLKSLGGDIKDIKAIGITNQRESTVVWDKNTGKPYHNAIIWLDMRTSSTVDYLLQKIPNHSKNINYLKPLCGLPLSPYFSALKLRWLKDNVPRVSQAMDLGNLLFGTIDSWLIWNLTGGTKGGVHITDVTNASRTMLMNIETLEWDKHLLKFFELPINILPDIRSSSEIYGYIKLNSLSDIPICGCLGDQQAALIGQSCFQSGQAKATYGTGCFLLYNTGNAIINSQCGLLTTVGYQLGKDANPVYALEGSVAIAGAAFGWLKDNMSLIEDLNDIEALAEEANDSNDVYFVPAFSGLYAPYWDQEARGIIVGLTEDVHKEHIVRATIEAVCFQVRDILEAMKKDCGIPITKLKVDGGVTTNKLLLQIQADLIGFEVVSASIRETTALGVALAAYRAITGDKKLDLKSSVSNQASFKPKTNENERDMRYSKWKMAIERSLGWDTSKPDGSRLII
ncbi:glycerol kinase [Condylostylus longicornis]|uniref:glycerol kinase n=1 Tax=Condylostylus longicornis TaxID=2530218 RepID=UPI00244DBCB0|nr:glycerol kinase [Condylostylus longicornis]